MTENNIWCLVGKIGQKKPRVRRENTGQKFLREFCLSFDCNYRQKMINVNLKLIKIKKQLLILIIASL